MKIRTVKDVYDAYKKIMETLMTQRKGMYFNLLVDEGDGSVSNCYFQPSGPVKTGGNFMVVGDIAKMLLLLLRHPNVNTLEYYEKENVVSGVFSCPEINEFNRLDNPSGEDEEGPQ